MHIIRCGDRKVIEGWGERRRRDGKLLSRWSRNKERPGERGGESALLSLLTEVEAHAVMVAFYPGSHVRPNAEGTARSR